MPKNMTEKDLRAMGLSVVKGVAVRTAALPKADPRKGKRRGKMNGLEFRYAQRLALLQAGGEIQWFAFESMKLRVSDSDRLRQYTPDFVVLTKSGEIEFHEVKGRKHDGGMVRLAVSADRYPFKFFIATHDAYGGWSVDPVRREDAERAS
jgi:hypothetical protein